MALIRAMSGSSGGGGVVLNPTVISHGAGNNLGNMEFTIDTSKKYMVVSGCMVSSDERCRIDYVEDGQDTILQAGINPNSSVTISGTTLTVNLGRGLYNFYSLIQLD